MREIRSDLSGLVMTANQSNRLRSQIEEEIATGVLRPGERLDETTLAERFGVSRSPVREALQQLAAAGLVEQRRHRGVIVSSPDPKQLLEMFEMMAELEAICARLAARRILISDESDLKQALKACEAAAAGSDTDAYYYENERFHRAIYTASGNAFIAEQAMALHRRLAPFRRLQLRVRNRMKASYQEHVGITEALMEGDGNLAASRAYAHVAIQGERFSDLMAFINRAAAE